MNFKCSTKWNRLIEWKWRIKRKKYKFSSDQCGQWPFYLCECVRSNKSKHFSLLLVKSMSFPFRHCRSSGVAQVYIISISYRWFNYMPFFLFHVQVNLWSFSFRWLPSHAKPTKNKIQMEWTAQVEIYFIALANVIVCDFYVKHLIWLKWKWRGSTATRFLNWKWNIIMKGEECAWV